MVHYNKRCICLDGGISPPLVSPISHFLNSESHRKPDRLLTLSPQSHAFCIHKFMPLSNRTSSQDHTRFEFLKSRQAREWKKANTQKNVSQGDMRTIRSNKRMACTDNNALPPLIPTIETCCMFKLHESGCHLQKLHLLRESKNI